MERQCLSEREFLSFSTVAGILDKKISVQCQILENVQSTEHNPAILLT